MKDKIFVDTNILVYAHDLDAGRKYEIASRIIEDLWESETGVISTQVIQEFYVTVTRKIPLPLSRAQARGIIENYFVWQLEVIRPDTILAASEIEDRHHLSFRDSLIVAAASQAKVMKILSEDFNHGQIIEGILIENPFSVQGAAD